MHLRPADGFGLGGGCAVASLRACQPQSVEAGAGGSTEQSSRQVPVVAARLGAGGPHSLLSRVSVGERPPPRAALCGVGVPGPPRTVCQQCGLGPASTVGLETIQSAEHRARRRAGGSLRTQDGVGPLCPSAVTQRSDQEREGQLSLGDAEAARGVQPGAY